MGLAASQARYLALTARKSDLEFQSQTINTRRIQLAYRTAEIAQAYSEGMNNKQIMMSTTEEGKEVWNEITFGNMLASGYVTIPSGGGTWNSIGNEQGCPYLFGAISQETDYYAANNAARTMTEAEAKALLTDPADISSAIFVRIEENSSSSNANNNEGGNTETVIKYKFNPNGISEALYERLNAEGKGMMHAVPKNVVDVSVNPEYTTSNSASLQSLLTSGQAQIVTREFFNFLVTQYGYNPETSPLTPSNFAAAQQEFDSNSTKHNFGSKKSIVDWRADEKNVFRERNYTEDDAQVLAQYERDTAEVQAQDKMLEVQEKNIETQHKAIETELEGLQKVITQNIEKTFKLFS